MLSRASGNEAGASESNAISRNDQYWLRVYKRIFLVLKVGTSVLSEFLGNC